MMTSDAGGGVYAGMVKAQTADKPLAVALAEPATGTQPGGALCVLSGTGTGECRRGEPNREQVTEIYLRFHSFHLRFLSRLCSRTICAPNGHLIGAPCSSLSSDCLSVSDVGTHGVSLMVVCGSDQLLRSHRQPPPPRRAKACNEPRARAVRGCV
jgi:hypothetical protein